MKTRSALLASLLIIFIAAEAQVRLPNIFADHMVLQQNSEVSIWGWASTPGKVTISESWDTVQVKAVVANTSFWRAYIKTPSAGGPYTISVKGGNEVVLHDVMIGEVWLCSGQSNMAWPLGGALDGKEEVPNANNANIRLFQVPQSAAETPQIRGEGGWQVCSPESAKGFSAVGYYFGKRLQEKLNVPIGLLNISWGGTPAEAWTPSDRIESDSILRQGAAKLNPENPWGPTSPGSIFNSMIYPVLHFGIAGAIWYQGESNAGNASTYETTMAQLIQSWREGFGKQFPFYYVQIAPYTYGNDQGNVVREQELKMLSIPHTGMVVIWDHVENVKDIHPKYKQPVGDRLANYALGDNYGQTGFAYKSPVYKSMTVEKHAIRISFDNAPTGLMSKGGDPTEFQIAGADGNFVPATAKLDGSDVIVSSKNVKDPVAVRFGWPNESIPNLFSKEGLPASCFRTDNWPLDKK